MAIYINKKGDLLFYKGDSGNIFVKNIPTNYNYDVYIAFSEATNGKIILEKHIQSNNKSEVVFSLSAEELDMFDVPSGSSNKVYYYGIKIGMDNGTEDTVIPKMQTDKDGNPTSSIPAKVIVYPKYVEGPKNDI